MSAPLSESKPTQSSSAVGKSLTLHALLLLRSTLVLLLMEFLNRGHLLDALAWVIQRPGFFVLNLLLLHGLFLVLAALTGRDGLASLMLAVLTVPLAYANGLKMKTLNLPLQLRDIGTASEAQDVMTWDYLMDARLLSLVLLFAALLFVLYKYAPRMPKLTVRARLIAGGLGAALTAGVLLLPVAYLDDVHQTGYGFSFVRTAIRPKGMDLRTAAGIGLLLPMRSTTAMAETTPGSPDYTAVPPEPRPAPQPANVTVSEPVTIPREKLNVPPGVKPNVIVVLSESFWDPTRMEKLTFSRDPAPFFRALQNQSVASGYLLSPRWGGMTSNVELEVLTGLSMRFFPEVIVYSDYIEKPVESLASITRRQGYRPVAISPWASWFFLSDRTYRNFGFSQFISLEFMRDVPKGTYMADSEIARLIIEETEKGPDPHFVFANTAQNHWPFTPGRYGEPEVKVTGVSGEAKGMIETYAQGILDADRMLQTLVEHFQQSKTPTVIVWFGDHLPNLGDNFMAYKAAGYIQGENDPDFLEKMYRVPTVVWSNYLPDRNDKLSFSTSFLGPYVLHAARIPGNPFTDWLYELSKHQPQTPHKHRGPAVNIAEADVALYEALTKNIVAGGQQVYPDLVDKIVDPNYIVGYGPIVLTKAVLTTEGGRPKLRIEGSGIPPSARIYLNGKPLPNTEWRSYDLITVPVPDANLAPDAQVQIRVRDWQKEIDTVTSNQITVQKETGPTE